MSIQVNLVKNMLQVQDLLFHFTIFFRHERPSDPDDPLNDQNIRDRYYGSNDPVADKIMKRAETLPSLNPPEDPLITTLYIGGLGLAQGYRGRDDLTAERFIVCPKMLQQPGVDRLYRIGDQAYWTAAGDLVFVGREDRQVKLQGVRVDVDDVERTLNQYGGVKQAVVVTSEAETGRQALLAFVIPEEDVKETFWFCSC